MTLRAPCYTSGKTSMSSISRYLATLAALAILLAALGLLASGAQAGVLSVIYPATGLGFAILWRFGARWWPALFAAQFAVSLTTSNYSLLITPSPSPRSPRPSKS